MKKSLHLFFLSAISLFFTKTVWSQAPANDFCTGAITLNNIANEVMVSFNNTQADYSLNGSCEGTIGIENNPDVWYEFTMPFNGNIKLSSSTPLIYVWYSGNCA